ncbi:flavin reductase family protein [Streptococcus ictaluri]|uniref:Flavin reductase-like domain protein n=1 Tax=Streptococcus ictaluri 707-05 TaxID=764299 RepID=G5JZB7_9STRE|nr:flavin reductase family protein [Streptococcus ictaluri]EHI70832.1 flavin reductase-like domain protein [Streptococcus ictaluri 707-05]
MQSIDKSQLSAIEEYKVLIGTVIPRPIAFVSTLSEDGQVNLAPFSFYNIVSYNPAILSISIQRRQGQMKDSARHILRTGEAVIHSVSATNLEAVNQAAKELPPSESELPLTGMTTVASTKIKTPGVLEAMTRFETKLYQHIPITNDKEEVIADLMLLEVLHYHMDETVYQETYVLADQLQPMSRLAGQDYAALGEMRRLERP